MRSLTIKAALAALLLSTLSTAAFAARGDHFQDRSPNIAGGDASPGYSTYARNGQLDAVLADLRDANTRIAYDRSHGLITAHQANRLHAEDAMIRREAVAMNARDGGAIPMGQYHRLMSQVDTLQHQL